MWELTCGFRVTCTLQAHGESAKPVRAARPSAFGFVASTLNSKHRENPVCGTGASRGNVGYEATFIRSSSMEQT